MPSLLEHLVLQPFLRELSLRLAFFAGAFFAAAFFAGAFFTAAFFAGAFFAAAFFAGAFFWVAISLVLFPKIKQRNATHA